MLEHGHLASRTKVGVVDTGALIGHPACVSVRKRSAPKSFVLDRGWVASPVLVHPLWGSTYFALSQPGSSDLTSRVMYLLPSEVRRSATQAIAAADATFCPYVAVGHPFIAPNGWIEPWTIKYGAMRFVSLRLPSWLTIAPEDVCHFVPRALDECERPSRSDRYDPLTSTPTLAGIRAIDAEFEVDVEVLWWNLDRFDGTTRHRSTGELVDSLVSDVRPHLIRGLVDEHGFPLWMLVGEVEADEFNLSAALVYEHFFHFDDSGGAKACAKELAPEFTVEVLSPDDPEDPWAVVATQKAPSDARALDGLTDALEALARRNGGAYDGRGTSID